MYWVAAGLFVLGALCGATIRLMMFVFVLLGAAVIATGAGGAQGFVSALLSAILTVVVLQVGYGVGFILRAGARSLLRRSTTEERSAGAVGGTLGEKRH